MEKLKSKILIAENELDANSAKSRLITLVNSVNTQLKDFFDKTEYQPGLEEIKGALRNSGEQLQRGLDQMINKQIKEMFGSKLLKASLQVDTSKHVAAFVEKLYPMTWNGMPAHWELLTMENGLLVFTAESEEILRDHYRKYLTTEDGKALHDLQISTADAINEYYSKIGSSSTLHFLNIAAFIVQFFESDPVTNKVVPRDIDHEYLISMKATLQQPDKRLGAA